MPYKFIGTHNTGTLKQISESLRVEYKKGQGFYQIVVAETVPPSKELVLFENGKYVTNNTTDIKVRLGLSTTGDVIIDPFNIPITYQVFIQSTAPNRKIIDTIPIVFYVEDDDDDEVNDGHSHTTTTTITPTTTPTVSGTNNSIQYLVNFDLITTGSIEEIEGDFSQLFKTAIGTRFNDCDCAVPVDIQSSSIFYLSNVARTKWSEVNIAQEKLAFTTYDSITRVSASGKLWLLSPLTSTLEEHPVRLEYVWSEEWSSYGISIGMLWGAVFGSFGSHPYVVTPEINYGNSDGSSSEYPPIAICECTEKEALKRKKDLGSNNGLEYESNISLNQKMDAICGHFMRVFTTHCNDLEH